MRRLYRESDRPLCERERALEIRDCKQDRRHGSAPRTTTGRGFNENRQVSRDVSQQRGQDTVQSLGRHALVGGEYATNGCSEMTVITKKEYTLVIQARLPLHKRRYKLTACLLC